MFYWFSDWIKEENSINTSVLYSRRILIGCHFATKYHSFAFYVYYLLLKIRVWKNIYFNCGNTECMYLILENKWIKVELIFSIFPEEVLCPDIISSRISTDLSPLCPVFLSLTTLPHTLQLLPLLGNFSNYIQSIISYSWAVYLLVKQWVNDILLFKGLWSVGFWKKSLMKISNVVKILL